MTVESEKDLAGLRRVGRVVGLALREMRENLEPGMTTGELDGVGARVFERFGARSAEGASQSSRNLTATASAGPSTSLPPSPTTTTG